MFQLSSSTTLFYKFFFPCIWLAFFSTFLVSVLILDDSNVGGFPIDLFAAGLSVFLILGFVFFYFTVFRLKRIDANGTDFFISSYFKNFKYPSSNVEKIKIRDLGIVVLGTLTLVAEGSFGRKIFFLMSERNVKKFLEAYPELEALFEV